MSQDDKEEYKGPSKAAAAQGEGVNQAVVSAAVVGTVATVAGLTAAVLTRKNNAGFSQVIKNGIEVIVKDHSETIPKVAKFLTENAKTVEKGTQVLEKGLKTIRIGGMTVGSGILGATAGGGVGYLKGRHDGATQFDAAVADRKSMADEIKMRRIAMDTSNGRG